MSSILRFLGEKIDIMDETPVIRELKFVLLSLINFPIVCTSDNLLSRKCHVSILSCDLSLIMKVSVKMYTYVSSALLVYQFISTDWSPAKYQISSEIAFNLPKVVGKFKGFKPKAIA